MMNQPSSVEITYKLKAITERGFKQFCDHCGQRNSIENLFYCMRCGDNCCWNCISHRTKKLDDIDGLNHPSCKCGACLKSYDDWLKQSNTDGE
jgi:hypothetical protein